MIQSISTFIHSLYNNLLQFLYSCNLVLGRFICVHNTNCIMVDRTSCLWPPMVKVRITSMNAMLVTDRGHWNPFIISSRQLCIISSRQLCMWQLHLGVHDSSLNVTTPLRKTRRDANQLQLHSEDTTQVISSFIWFDSSLHPWRFEIFTPPQTIRVSLWRN